MSSSNSSYITCTSLLIYSGRKQYRCPELGGYPQISPRPTLRAHPHSVPLQPTCTHSRSYSKDSRRIRPNALSIIDPETRPEVFVTEPTHIPVPVTFSPLTSLGIILPKKLLQKLQQATSIEEQMEVLSLGCRMSDAMFETHLKLCRTLEAAFQRTFPSCLLVPFGAPISGHAVVTSDCDISLLPQPTKEDQQYLTGRAYYSVRHLAILEKMTTSGSKIKTHWRQKLTRLRTLPPPHFPEELKKALTTIQKLRGCSNIVPIHSSHCSIVKFYFTGLRCDLSINNRLGAHNTRLMRAYYDFDPRVATLVPILRMWIRFIGIDQSQLNSYGISLMLIYALQNTAPPVLPCLQKPGSWPKNMEWFSAQKDVMATCTSGTVVSGWRCGFDPPGSLLPSENSLTVAELLLHFFWFYHNFNFSCHVVAIHCNSTEGLAIHQAIKLAAEHGPHQHDTTQFQVSGLCIQDPFNLSHNVTKSFTKKSLSVLRKQLHHAYCVLQEQLQQEGGQTGNLFALFIK